MLKRICWPGNHHPIARSYLLTVLLLLVQAFYASNAHSQTLSSGQHRLIIQTISTENEQLESLALKTSFPNRQECLNYVYSLDSLLARKGFAAASVDSLQVTDTLTTAYLFLGEQYQWEKLKISGLNQDELIQTGLPVDKNSGQFIQQKKSNSADLNFIQQKLESWQNQLLEYMYNNGYPFASVQLDSLTVTTNRETATRLSGILTVNRGVPYNVDSIHVNGSASISSKFLHRYLDIPKGMPFRKTAFNTVSDRLRELPYLRETQAWNLRFGGNGAILDLFLEPKKSSQINVLLGLLPSVGNNGENRFQVTGEANLNLKNALGNGETIGVNWQQLQVKSPRLNLLFQQPYLFGSAFGILTQFDLFKKDSSFLTINTQLGLQYAVSARQTGKIFLQLLRTNLVNIDTFRIKSSRRLPVDSDVGIVNLGVDYDLYTTNYRRNPRRGWELFGAVSAGTRTIRRNNAILDIKDPAFDYSTLYDTVDLKSYQFRVKLRLARYIPIGKQATIQLLSTGAWVQSPSLYRNELFQIGGYKLMRGFDEESIFSSRYIVNTLEYRYLVGINSYFFGFLDLGFTASQAASMRSSNSLLGAGLGMAFETTAGFFNLSLAAGKRDDTPFNLRQTKIHLGYVNYF